MTGGTSLLRDHTVGNVWSLALAAAIGAAFALVVGLPLMRLSGLGAGIATFGVLEITHNVLRYWEKIGPGLNTFSSVPETTTSRSAMRAQADRGGGAGVTGQF